MRNSSLLLLSVVVIVLPLAGAATNVNAQSTIPQRPSPPEDITRRTEALRAPSIRERQLKMLEMEREMANPPPLTSDQQKLALAQIAEDFRQIQVVNNKMMSGAMTARELNYASIADTTAEIRRRAVRLRDNLHLAKSDQKNAVAQEFTPPGDAARFKTELLSLDKALMSFIGSPIFKAPASVIHVDESAKARRNLETVIELSAVLNKTATRLKKNSEKP